jgi:DNA polymerase-3 subunit gamma/tau
VTVDAPLALYRRYRPDTFADLIGQDHVTGPLSAALDNNRVHHAYLFSGPRGCGKTTSARILARALNCEHGPSSIPCGKCDSCVELARGGSGSVDVIEIDAASHGGVDDARDLRERAFFAPMMARYKVYIIDEAHMVTTQGFNALLKLVEEPPSHVRFVFATTEPEKVIGTIRSRTHHYPFRLVPPKILGDYLLDLCAREGVEVHPTVVPLVVRAGGGSVRDSLSVLDQLIGGSGPEGVTYASATSLLGFTPEALIDETVDALAADDGGTVFAVIDKVVDSGLDPRRYAEDLLQRLRDLVIVSVVPDAVSRGLIEGADDQAERLTAQAARFGRAELTRAADVVSEGLTEMRGATAPRLLLELMCARILLPGVDGSVEGLAARLARLERRLSMVGEQAPPAPPLSMRTRTATPPARPSAPTPELAAAGEPRSASPAEAEVSAQPPGPRSVPEEADGPREGPPGPAPAAFTLVDVRQLWPGVLDRVKSMRRYPWILLSQNAHVKDLSDGVLTIGLVNSGARDSFVRSGADEIVRQALIDELGVDWRVEAIIDTPAGAAPSPLQSQPPQSRPPQSGKIDRRVVADVPEQTAALAPVERSSAPATPVNAPPSAKPEDTDVRDDDEVVDAGLSSHDLLARELGAQLIDDIRHD